MKEWLSKAFSDPSGLPDDARLAAFLIVLTFLGNSILAIFKGQSWDPQQFGIGAGALAAGVGVWFGQRKGN